MVTISQNHHDEEMNAAEDQLVFTNPQFFGPCLVGSMHRFETTPIQHINLPKEKKWNCFGLSCN